MIKILITGGAGFIGSHTCISLLEQNFQIVVVDSCINSDPLILNKLKMIMKSKGINNFNLNFYKGDIRDEVFLENIFLKESTSKEKIEGVIHFAGLKSVNESVENPFLYWDNNVIGSFNLLKIMNKFDCRTIVFSSSATIYSANSKKSITEDFSINPINPYGHTKASVEYMLNDIFNSSKNKWSVANLRYFNPIGAHESGLIGENPLDKPNNLFPNICRVAQGIYEKLNIYGNDWETNDGTCIRDYVHVMDLADAHLSALNYLSKNKKQIIDINIGTGKGTSVLELVGRFCSVNNCKVPFVFCERRSGDISSMVADNNKAITVLNWFPKRSLDEMCEDGWRWQINNQNCLF